MHRRSLFIAAAALLTAAIAKAQTALHPAQVAPGLPRWVYFTITAGAAPHEFTVNTDPRFLVVHLNGLLQTPGYDYLLDGRTIQFQFHRERFEAGEWTAKHVSGYGY